MISLSLVSDTYGTLDLDALAHGSSGGAQAQPGLTGLGLPPVDAQWSSGTGDGSDLKGRRALPRPLDLPIEFFAGSREALIPMMDAASLIIDATDLKLFAKDDVAGWSYFVNVVRTGGGDYAIGQDGDGEYRLAMIVTVQSGDPFWTSESVETLAWDSTELWESKAVTNPGTADAHPVWTIEGPANGFTVEEADSGRSVTWNGFVDKGSSVTIDTGTGRIYDGYGGNQYGLVSAAPDFFPLSPGGNTLIAGTDISSAEFAERAGVGTLNRIANPSLTNDTDGWDVKTFVRDATDKNFTTDTVFVEADHSGGESVATAPNAATGASVSYTIDDLTVGGAYEFSFDYDNNWTGPIALPSPTHGMKVWLNGLWSPLRVRVYAGDRIVANDAAPLMNTTNDISGRFRLAFTAPSSEVRVEVLPQCMRVLESKKAAKVSPVYFRGWKFVGVKLDNFALTSPGLDYFDGDTADTADYTYSWTGTAGNSTSVRLHASALDTSSTAITCNFNPRKRMVL